MQIERTTLRGSRIALEPLEEAKHPSGLARAIEDGELWELAVTIVPHPRDLPDFFRNAEVQFKTQKELAFAIVDLEAGLVLGSTRFRCIEIAHKRVEIGFTFIANSWQKTYANTEAKYLMLKHAFEHWHFNRVEFLTDALNKKSRAAILGVGASDEGVMRSHMVMRDGCIRDSVLFSVIFSEWPEVKNALEAKLRKA